jgi:DNA-binding transcriptional LysR family regulator
VQLRAAAIAGQGLIYQPLFIVAEEVRAGSLVALEFDQPSFASGGIYAVYLPDRNPPAKVRAFIDFVAARFGPEPPWERAKSRSASH